MKQSWLVLRSSSGCVLGSGNGASVLAFVVGWRFLNSCFKWPFVVDGESSRCLEMRSSVSPVQVVRWPFFISRINVEGVGLKHVSWRNYANYFLVLFIWTMELSARAGWRVSASEMSHRPYYMLRLPMRIYLLFSSDIWSNFLLKCIDSHRHKSDQLILRMHFAILKNMGFFCSRWEC